MLCIIIIVTLCTAQQLGSPLINVENRSRIKLLLMFLVCKANLLCENKKKQCYIHLFFNLYVYILNIIR